MRRTSHRHGDSTSILSIHEAAVVSAICFGLFIYWSTQAVLSGFPEAKVSDSGDAWLALVESVLAAAALLYLRARNFDVWSLYPQPDMRGTLFGLGLFAAAWVAGVIATAPFTSPGGHSQVIEFSYSGVSIASTVIFAMVNGTFEEVFLLGVLVRGLRAYGVSIAIGFPLLIRLLYHLYQGPLGAVWVLAFGLTFTLFYVRIGRLWPAVFAHMLWDIVPVVLADAQASQ
jgi:membrane protease YdiL (CAAX protease family)